MKYKLITFLTLCFSITSLNAQDARSILDKARNTYNTSGGITADFVLEMKDLKTNSQYNYNGKAFMKGDKFKMDIPDGTTWFDGMTQWMYIKESGEVNISIPSGEELQDISPSALFSIYDKGFALKYNGEKTIKGRKADEVELTPQKKGSDIKRIIVQIDKITNIFSSITIINKSGFQNELIIKKLQTKVNLPDATFVFNKKDYPGVEIVDLR